MEFKVRQNCKQKDMFVADTQLLMLTAVELMRMAHGHKSVYIVIKKLCTLISASTYL